MRGEVVYFYAFDVANEVMTHRVRTVLGAEPTPLELRLKHAAPKDVAFHRPLSVTAPLNVRLAGQPVRAQVHVFEVGVVSVVLRADFARAGLPELSALHHPELDDGRTADDVARDLCGAACRDLGGALVRPSPAPEPEAYTVFFLSELDGDGDVGRWLGGERAHVAGLLSGLPPDRVSDAQVAEVLRLQWSLERDDLVVIDWDAALVVDLSGPAEDLLYVLEIANLQLEEFRVMDRALDRYLNRAYEDLERRSSVPLYGSTSAMLRKLRWFRVDLTKLADEVTNITKFVGDWYLARVYLGARERFHLDRWRQSVEQRLGQLDRLYGVVQTELNERRMLWLEVIIVVLFVIDLIALLWRH